LKLALWPGIAGREIEARLREVPGVELALAENTAQLSEAAPDIEALVIGGHFFEAKVAEILRGYPSGRPAPVRCCRTRTPPRHIEHRRAERIRRHQ
jgi:hypothetical protein